MHNMNKILLGTTSENKINIVKEFFKNDDFEIVSKNVVSGILEQPLSEETTIEGAINRAKNAIVGETDYLFSVGLEGGLAIIDSVYNLVCVAAVFYKNKTYIGISNKIKLPKSVSDDIKTGKEFGKVIREYKSTNDKESEIIEELITRKKSFLEALNGAYIQLSTDKI